MKSPRLFAGHVAFSCLFHVVVAVLAALFFGAPAGLAQAPLIGKIASGDAHTLVINYDGTVWASGANWNGQLGVGSLDPSPLPLPVGNLDIGPLGDVIKVAAGGSHSLALKSDGTVWTWGANWSGQLGDGTYDDQWFPVQVSGLSGVTAIAAGSDHSLALKSDGTVWAWGSGLHLGNGVNQDSTTPVQIPGLTGVVAISAGWTNSLALKSDGTVRAWGYNWAGQLGNNSTTSSLVPVVVSSLTGITAIATGSYHSVARKSDGTLWSWGENASGELGDGTNTRRLVPVQVSATGSFAAPTAGAGTSAAIKSDGTVWAWGYLTSTQRSNVPVANSALAGVVALEAGDYFFTAAKSDGSFWTWGANDYGQGGNGQPTVLDHPSSLLGLSGIKSVAAGPQHNLAVSASGTVLSWGDNFGGQLGRLLVREYDPVPGTVAGVSNAVAVAAGYGHSLALDESGHIWAWGDNSQGQLGRTISPYELTPAVVAGLSGVKAIAANGSYSLAVKTDGTVWKFGGGSAAPVQVSGLSDIVRIAAGDVHFLALKNDGAVLAWGNNASGQLGNGTYVNSSSPVAVSGLADVVEIAAGTAHSLALKSDGTVWVWGSNSFGQLAVSNSTPKRNIPGQVAGVSSVVSISAGAQHSLAIRKGQPGWAWGFNSTYELGSGPATYFQPTPSAVEAFRDLKEASQARLGLRADGTILVWSDTYFGQSGLGLNWERPLPGPFLGVNLQHSVPRVDITSSTAPSGVAIGRPRTLTVTDMALGGSVPARVELYFQGIKIGESTQAPFAFTFVPPTWGTFDFRAIAIDSAGGYSWPSYNFQLVVPFDTDTDGLPDWWEQTYFASLATNGSGDADGDGLSDATEQQAGTNPNLADTDGDTISDYDEVQAGTSPTKADTDGDGNPDAVDALPKDPDFTFDRVAVTQYAVVDLGSFYPSDINDNSAMVGSLSGSPASWVDFQTAPILPPSNSALSSHSIYYLHLNNAGQIVFTDHLAIDDFPYEQIVCTASLGGPTSVLSDLNGDEVSDYAASLNNNGLIAGFTFHLSQPWAVVHNPATETEPAYDAPIDAISVASWATAQVGSVGFSDIPGFPDPNDTNLTYPLPYTDGSTIEFHNSAGIDDRDSNREFGDYPIHRAINDLGQIVGTSLDRVGISDFSAFTSSSGYRISRAVVWPSGGGTPISLGVDCYPASISNLQIVTGTTEFEKSCVWIGQKGWKRKTLPIENEPYPNSIDLDAINDRGQILAWSGSAIWQNGLLYYLDERVTDTRYYGFYTTDINNKGQIIGTASFYDPEHPETYGQRNVLLVPVQIFLDEQNKPYQPDSEALGVSNFVTINGLPQDSLFNDVSTDPENFRLQANLLDTTVASIPAKLEVIRDVFAGGTVTPVTIATYNYTLDQKEGNRIRGRFLRLVSDANDDAASGAGPSSDPNNQTILVKLGDRLKASYDVAPGSKAVQEIQVGRPASENDNAVSHKKHDIRELKVNIVVLKNSAGTGPVVPQATVDADVETVNERLAQAGIRLNVLGVNLGAGSAGVDFPTYPGANYADGFDMTLALVATTITPDEHALFSLKDADKDSIDIFYVDFSTATEGAIGVRGGTLNSQINNATGTLKLQNNIVMSSNRTTLTAPHEILHVLLNSNHRPDPATALFKGGTTASKDVGGTKRIGPYPEAATVGNNDVTTIRKAAEKLP